MPIVSSYYARDDDDLALGALSVVGSDEAPGYPGRNLVSRNPAKEAKLTTTSGDWVGHHTNPIAPVAAALIYQYLDEAIEVRFQMNSSDSWGSPPIDVAFTIPAKRRDGPEYQRWTENTLVLTGIPDATSYAYWRLVVVGTNSQPVVIGRLMLLSVLRPVTVFFDSEIGEDDDFAGIEQRTALKVENIVVIEGPRRGFSGALIATDVDAGTPPYQAAADFRALAQSSGGRLYPFLFMIAGEPWLVRFESSKIARAHRSGGHQRWTFEIREPSRGLPHP